MLIGRKESAYRNTRRERRLLQDEQRCSGSLQCPTCPEWGWCGGLKIAIPSMSCLDLCCGGDDSCDAVCRRNKKYVEQVREIDGYDLSNVPRKPALDALELPSLVPMFYHGNGRVNAYDGDAVCIPFFKVISKSGRLKCPDDAALRRRFQLAANVPVILSATAKDHFIEAWWNLGIARRKEIIRALRDIGVLSVTTPNYSLFTSQPRWDDMHSMKRIALAWEEFLSQGMPAALHVNARCERDSERWAEFIAMRPEVTTIAFEFGTGAGRGECRQRHTHRLIQIAKHTSRPLQLLVRGASNQIAMLRTGFQDVSVLDTTTFMKTMYRYRATERDGAIMWQSDPTPKGEPLDELLLHNIGSIRKAMG